jgi:RNA polymerase sigma factor (sigma-70 family)
LLPSPPTPFASDGRQRKEGRRWPRLRDSVVGTAYNAVMSPSDASPGRFATTHWSVIVAARDGEAVEARAALADLCRAYWYPLYAYVRHQGNSADQAQDLTQEFFTRLLEKDFFDTVDPEKGKFRSFLLAACKHFLANERDRERAQKRGGGQPPLSLDLGDAEARFGREPDHTLTAEKLFERRWALALLQEVLARLREEHAARSKEALFDRLRGFLVGERQPGGHAAAAAELGLTEGAVKVAVHRLRQRYRELIREEIGRTVHDPKAIDDEIRALFAALAP